MDTNSDMNAVIAAVRESVTSANAATARALGFALERLDAGDVALAREMIIDAITAHTGRPLASVLQ